MKSKVNDFLNAHSQLRNSLALFKKYIGC